MTWNQDEASVQQAFEHVVSQVKHEIRTFGGQSWGLPRPLADAVLAHLGSGYRLVESDRTTWACIAEIDYVPTITATVKPWDAP